MINKKPILSVIVPIYNTECFLEACVNSIIKQTLDDIEIILVDDGSTDNCPNICDLYAEKDKRITVIHKQNGGLSSARNAGINISTGKYIGFVDSDDTIMLEMYEAMLTIAQQENVDFVMCDYIKVTSSYSKMITLDIKGGLYTKNEIIQFIYPILITRESINYGPFLSVCNCIYKKEFLVTNELMFSDEILWSEDCLFSAIVGYYADSFYYMKNNAYYLYYQNFNSISTTFRNEAWDVYCKMHDKMIEFFINKKEFNFSRQLKLHALFISMIYLKQLNYTNLSLIKKYKIRNKVINSPLLIKALKGFKTCKTNSWKLNIVIKLIKIRAVLALSISAEIKKLKNK